MKIGILTFHRAHNYGAVLQCYALMCFLKLLGHEVLVIDYRQSYIEHVYRPINWLYFFKKIGKPHKFVKYLFEIKKNYLLKGYFESFQKKWLCLTEKCNAEDIPTNFDAYVIGSDQLWSDVTGGVDFVYTGQFNRKPNAKIIGYAISTTVGYLKKIGDETVKNILRNFYRVSFREQNVAGYVNDCLQKHAQVCLDPTLLLGSETWNSLCNDNWKHRKYVLLYQVRGTSKDRKLISSYARQYASKTSCELIDLSSYKKAFSVEDFVSAFRYAEAVITTSFHATVFSVIFERPLFVYKLGEASDDRMINLLEMLKISNCVYAKTQPPENPALVDFGMAKTELASVRKISESYLKLSLTEYGKS